MHFNRIAGRGESPLPSFNFSFLHGVMWLILELFTAPQLDPESSQMQIRDLPVTGLMPPSSTNLKQWQLNA